jgi:hypothetical protein
MVLKSVGNLSSWAAAAHTVAPHRENSNARGKEMKAVLGHGKAAAI